MKEQGQRKAKVLIGSWPGTPASVSGRWLDVALLDMKELVLRAFSEPLPAGVLVKLLRGWRVPDRRFGAQLNE